MERNIGGRHVKLRPSRVLERLRAGKTAYAFKTNLADARVVEIAAMSGIFDALWLDMEHVPNSIAAVEQQVRAAAMHGSDAIVRVCRGSYSDLVRPLEMGAAGIMVPHIMGVEDARQVAGRVRFHPIGRRPLDGGNADGAYCLVPLETYIEHANSQCLVIVQIEDPEPVEELEAIAAIEGIDMLFFGPADFSHSIGVPGEHDHPEVERVRRLIPRVARGAGKFAGTVTAGASRRELIEMGYQFINTSSDVRILGEGISKIAAELDL